MFSGPAHSQSTLAAATIVHQQVGRALRVRDNVGDSQLKDTVRDLLGRPEAALEAPQVAHEPSDERRRHAGAGGGPRARVGEVAGADDVAAGGEDVELGPVGAAVDVLYDVDAGAVGLRHAHGEGLGQPGGRGVGRGLVVVAGRHDAEDPFVVGRQHGVVQGGDVPAAEGHVQDGLSTRVLGDDVVDGPGDAGEDGRGGALRRCQCIYAVQLAD